jgi:Ca2+-binding RTX toxin-like protein
VNLETEDVTGSDATDDAISGCESVEGSAFADQLTGSADSNTLSGLDGKDVIIGGAGTDTLLGGAGVDDIRAKDSVRDVVDGGTETDKGHLDKRLDAVTLVEQITG